MNDKLNLPLVSFVVNCFNGSAYLKKCLDSILNQTYINWELIFWDNGSTDHSSEIFFSYNDDRFKYFKSEFNVSLGQARNWAINKCTGDYIALLDVDDSWVPEKTSLQIEGILKSNAVLSYGGMEVIVENANYNYFLLPKYKSGYIFKENLMQFDINVPTAMIKREALINKKLNFDPEIMASEEYCLFMQLIVNEYVYVINKPIATYLIRKNSLTNKYISRWAIERRYTLNKIIETNIGIKSLYHKEFKEAYGRANYYEACFLISQNEKKKAILKLRENIFINFKYFILYTILIVFPISIWHRIHNIKNKRY